MLVAAPWLFGAALTVMVSKLFARDTGTILFSTGLGGALGFFAASGLIFFLKEAAVPVTSFVQPAIMLAVSVASLSILSANFLNHIAAIKTLGMCAALVVIGATVAFAVYHAILWPIFAWDALGGEWKVPGYAQKAVLLIGPAASDAFLGEVIPHRHPSTNIALLAWTGWVVQTTGNFGQGLVWFLLYLSCVLIMSGVTLVSSTSTKLAALMAWLTAGLPLFENHALSTGYTEMLISTVLLAGCALIFVGLRQKNILLIVCGFLYSALLFKTKSTGSAYFAAVVFGFAVSQLLSAKIKYRLAGACATAVCMFVLVENGFNLNLFGMIVRWDPSDQVVEYAGRTQSIDLVNGAQIAANQFHALFRNLSYSVATLSIIFIATLQNSDNWSHEDVKSAVFILATWFFGFAFFSATQLSEYGMLHALPGADTQNSRSFMPLTLLHAFLILHVVCQGPSRFAR